MEVGKISHQEKMVNFEIIVVKKYQLDPQDIAIFIKIQKRRTDNLNWANYLQKTTLRKNKRIISSKRIRHLTFKVRITKNQRWPITKLL